MIFLFKKYKKLMIFLVCVHNSKTTYIKNGESIKFTSINFFLIPIPNISGSATIYRLLGRLSST